MKDRMLRIYSKEIGVRGFICTLANLVQDAAARHGTSPAATVALGYGLAGGLLLGSLIKVQQRVALKVEGNGPLQKMVVEADNYGRVRGYVQNPAAAAPAGVPATDVSHVVGTHGFLTVIKDLRVKEMYEGVVPLQTGKLDVDLIYYLMQSEQTPSLIEIDVALDNQERIHAVGGALFQTLPGYDPGALMTVANHMDDLPPLAAVLSSGRDLEQIAGDLFAGISYEILESYPLRFQCSCSWETAERALILMGSAEIKQLMAEGEAVIDCHFCRQRYRFGQEALETILDKV